MACLKWPNMSGCRSGVCREDQFDRSWHDRHHQRRADRQRCQDRLLTTAGFRDILEMRRGYREEIYNNKLTPPKPLVPRDLRLPVTERINASGEVVTPLDTASLRAAATI